MRALSMVLATAVLATGCVSESYKIGHSELVRMSELPPEQRTQAVRVDQEAGAGEDVTPAQPVGDDTQIVLVPHVDVEIDAGGHRHLGSAPVGHVKGGSGAGLHMPNAGANDKAAAIVYLTLAVVAMVAVIAVEASRFDGTVRLHPMHPLHVVGPNGDVLMIPAAWLDRDMAEWADHAVVRSAEGPWHPIAAAPLERTGWTYGLFGGEGTYASADGSQGTGFAATIQLGYFVTQHVGIVGDAFLGWRDNLEHQTLFEGRFMGEVQVLPLDAGAFHAGVYGAIGEAVRSEDGVMGPDADSNTLALGGGAMMQLEVHTRIALTARFGVDNAHGETAQDALFGVSVY